MDLKRLRYFCTIVEQGQISRAAEVLCITQPALSQRLHELEEELGVPLILRKGRQWKVTEAGKLLYQRARRILMLVEETSSDVQELTEGSNTRIAIGISTMCLSALLDVLPLLYEVMPGIKFRLIHGNFTNLEALVNKHQIDFAITQPPHDASAYQVYPLPPRAFCVLVAGRYRSELTGSSIHLSELASTPLVVTRRTFGAEIDDFLLDSIRKVIPRPNILIDCHDIRTLMDVIDTGIDAVAVVPESELARRTLHRSEARKLVGLPDSFNAAIIHQQDHFLSSAARFVIQKIIEHAASQNAPTADDGNRQASALPQPDASIA
ncbi:LysR family transcriptional regulator [Crenobacter intestini]|uniref:LysR family transcriptional regulator n=1 Tax=Crenobacter intestini TaxID=2563443 RepID=A0A4T0URT0_9NEIS|nr:LysR family transcriptional regulator [Crenobacter intestini]TIC81341.1 LysR family transcriptional regulator [Crenobacter intestini]